MSKVNFIELERLIEQLSNYVNELVEQIQSNPIDQEADIQLKEISKAIERLESSNTSIPVALLDEKSRLLSIVGSKIDFQEQALNIYNRLNELTEKLRNVVLARNRRFETLRHLGSKRSSFSDLLDPNSIITLNSNELEDVTGCKPLRVFVIDEWYEVKTWRDAKVKVYNRLIKENPDIELPKPIDFSKDKYHYRHPKALVNNLYTEANLNTNETIKHCRKSMEYAGYGDPTLLKFEVIKR